MNKEKSVWVSAHLFYDDDFNFFLKEAVRPFVLSIQNKTYVEQYFFIRYWEKGPHIRLRIKVDELKQEEIKKYIQDYFSAYFKNSSSEKTADLARRSDWYPDRSIQFIEYEAEVERYGGNVAIEIAEKQFHYSSDTVFDVLTDHDQWDYDLALGTAIQLHTIFAASSGMDLTEASKFFEYIHKNWLPRSYYFFEKDIDQHELQQRRNETLRTFEASYNNTVDVLMETVSGIWEAVKTSQGFDNPCLNDWNEGMRQVSRNLGTLDQRKEIVYSNYLRERTRVSEVPDIWSIYDSYIHMTNNRLGILNRDEGFITYLLSRSLKEMDTFAVEE